MEKVELVNKNPVKIQGKKETRSISLNAMDSLEEKSGFFVEIMDCL